MTSAFALDRKQKEESSQDVAADFGSRPIFKLFQNPLSDTHARFYIKASYEPHEHEGSSLHQMIGSDSPFSLALENIFDRVAASL